MNLMDRFQRAVGCLRLELPEQVYKDFCKVVDEFVAAKEHALAEKESAIKRFQEVHDAIIDVLEGRPTKDEHTLVKAVQEQARELERVSHDLDFTNQCTIPDLESQLEQALKTAFRFTKMYKEETEYAYSQKELRAGALSNDEDYQIAKSFLATPAATALQQAKETT